MGQRDDAGAEHALTSPFSRGVRTIAAVVAIAVVAAGFSLTPAGSAEAAVVQWGTNAGTEPNFQTTVYGDFITGGNGVLECSGLATGVTAANVGSCEELHGITSTNTQNVNDNFVMVNNNSVTGFTTNSSSATVSIPSGATVVKAFLGWAGNTGVYQGQTSPYCAATARGVATRPAGSTTGYRTATVQLKVGAAAITSVAPASLLEDPSTQATALYYSATADVTANFAGAVTGAPITVSAGNIWAPTGPGCFAGWTLTLVYDYGTFIAGNTSSAPKRVIYYEGHVRQAAQEAALTVGFTGFTAVGTGTRVAFSLSEGDRGIVGDTVSYARGTSAANATVYTEVTNSYGATGNIGVGRAEGSVRYFGTGTDANFTNQSTDNRSSVLSAVTTGDSYVNLRVGTTGDSYLLTTAVLSVPTAGIQIEKALSGATDTQSRLATEAASFTITITNTGSGSLSNIVVTDDRPGCARTLTGVTLAPQASTSYVCTAPSSASGYVTTATTTATGAGGGSISDSDSTTVLLTAIALTKTSSLAAGATGRAGDVVTYTFVATNTGRSPLTGVSIVDPLPGLSAITYAWPGAVGSLAAGQSVTATATRALTQADVDAGSVANTATTTASDNDAGPQPTATASRTTTITAAGALAVTKTGTLAAGATGRVGDVVTYSFTVRNTGNVTLTNGTLTDPLPGLSPPVITWPTSTAGTLAPGSTATAIATYTIRQSDVDRGSITNTATATGRTPAGATATAASPASVVQTAAPAPSITTTKSGSAAGSAAVGNVITYTFSARNSGNVTLTGVAIADPLPGLSALSYTWPGAVGTLSPGQTVTATATYTIRQADVDSGSVRNTATATGTPPTGAAVTGASPQSVVPTAASAPSVALTKSGALAAGSTGVAGNTVNYSFALRNSGNVTLTGVTIADPLAGLSPLTYTWPGTPGTLAPGQTATATATYALKQSDVDAGAVANAATATATPPTGANLMQTRSATVPVTAAPALVVTKSGAAASPAAVGDVVTYTFTARNSGNVTLTQVAIADPLPGLGALSYTWPGTAGVLTPGQTVTATATYAIRQSDVDAGIVRNTATASGRSPAGVSVTASSPQSVVPTVAAAPAVVTTKSGVAAGTASVGDVVTYTFTARNSGNVTLTGVTIADPLPGLSAVDYGTWPSGTAGTLAPGQTVNATATYVLTQTDVDAGSVRNTATSSGISPAGIRVTGASPQVTVPTAASAPATVLTKSGALAAGSTGVAGNTVNYAFALRNTGNVTLTGVTIADPLAGLSTLTYSWPGTAGTLAPEQTVTATATYTLKQSDVDAGSVANTATGRGTSPGAATVTSTAPATVPVAAAPALLVTKSGSAAGTAAVGSVITYTFSARNSGNVTLTGVAIADPLPGLSALSYTWPGAVGTLSPGQTVTATATYTIRQADVDAGSVRNTATATGTPPTGPAVTASSPQSTVSTVARAPSIVTTKSGSAAGTGGVGSVITYSFTARNSGNVTLSGVAIADPLPGLSPLTYSWPSTAGTLAPGQTVTATATYTIRQADVDAGSVRNTATSTGTGPAGTVVTAASPQVAVPTAASAPSVVLTKSGALAAGSTGVAGDPVNYSFSLRNSGNVTLTGVTIADPLAGLSPLTYTWPGTVGTLAPGQTVTATATYTLTQSDVDAGAVANTATATATPPAGANVTQSRSATVPVTGSPALVVTKTGAVDSPGTGAAGDTVSYSFTVRNAGNVTLTQVALTDAKPGLSTPVVAWPGAAGTLAPGATATATASYTITQADVDAGSIRNTASATGRPPTGPAVTALAPESVIPTAAAAPGITTTKTGVAAGTRAVGDVVTYAFRATNSGNVTLTGVAIADPLAGLSPLSYTWPGTPGTLAPGQSVTATASYTIMQADVDAGSVRNTATTTGTPPVGTPVSGASLDSVVTTAAPAPAVSLTKSGALAAGSTGTAGGTVDYSFALANTGNVTLTGVTIADPLPGLSALAYTWPGAAGTLAPGQTVTATATYTLSQSDIDSGSIVNTATGRGTSPGGATVTQSRSATVPVDSDPALSVTKDGTAAGGGAAGSQIAYSFTIRNTGNVTLSRIALTDSKPGVSAPVVTWPAASGVLAPGQSATATASYTITQADVDAGSVRNTATVNGTPPTGPAVTASSPASVVQTAAASPSVVTTKSASVAGTGVVGDVITYSFTARNAGNVTLTGVGITDQLAGLSPLDYTWPGAPGTLAPGQTGTATATYTITQADVDAGRVRNTATSTGTPPTGPDVSGDSPLVSTPTAASAPAAVLTKSGALAPGATGVAGDAVDYSFSLRNSGNVTLTGVAITDPLPGLSPLSYTWPGATGTLAPGQTVTATASYTLTQTDVDAGAVANTATSTARPPVGAAITRTTSATVRIASGPSIAVTKIGSIASPGTGIAGDTITYAFTVRNAGNVTLTQVALADSKPGVTAPAITWPGTPGTLAPGQIATATASYVLQQAEVDAGAVRNTATATGRPPTGPAVTALSPESVVPTAAASASIVTTKTGSIAGGESGIAGDTVTYAFSARNTGNVTLTGVAIADPLPGISARVYTWPGTPGTLAPGQTVTATASYRLTQADVDAGDVRNTATSTGTPPTGPAVTGSSPENVVPTAAAAPATVLSKSAALAAGSTGVAGDTVDYSFSLRNSGNVTLTQVAIADPLPGISGLVYTWPGDEGTLAPGQTVTATAAYSLTQADVDAGSVANTASSTATDPRGTIVTRSAPATVPVAATPALLVTKAGAIRAPGTGLAGDTVDYTFGVRNTGNVTLTDVTLADPLPGLSAPSITWPGPAGTLAPGEAATATATYTITQADVDAGSVRNTATASAAPPTGPRITAQSPRSTVATAAAAPAITTTKSGIAAAPAGVGSTVTFTITTRNTGNVTLTGVEIDDTLAGLSPLTSAWPGTVGTLAPREVVVSTGTYTITQADVDAGSVRNTATSTGSPPTGPTVSGTSAPAVVPTVASAASITTTKTGTLATGAAGGAGDVVDYAFSVRNSGNVTLTDVTVTDPLPGLSAMVYTWPGDDGILAPGQTATATATYTVTQSDVDAGSVANTVTGSGAPPTGAPASRTASATVALPPNPVIEVSKSGAIAAPAVGAVGDEIDYSFVIRNAGNVTLGGISLVDSKPGVTIPVVTWPAAPGVLAPGQQATATASYTITQDDVDAGEIENTASVSGRSPSGLAATDTAPVSVVPTAEAAPSIATQKSAAYLAGGQGRVVPGDVGDVIQYTFVAINDGNVTLTDVSVDDPQPGLTPIVYGAWPSGTPGTLAPGESVTATARHTITQADVDAQVVTNTATSTGTAPVGDDVTGVSPTVETPTAAATPDFTVTKSGALAAGSTGTAGSRVDYTFSLRNTGNQTLTQVALADPLPGLSPIAYTWPATPGTLAPGQTVTARASATLSQSDVDAGSVVNTVTGSATPPAGGALTRTDSATVVVPSGPALVVTKSGAIDAPGTGVAGDTVTFTIGARNTGNVTLTDVAITDSLPGLSSLDYTWPGPDGTLAPGQSVTATASYEVTQADVDAGTVSNTATATGTPPTGPPVTASSPVATVRLATAGPAIDVVKTGAITSGTGEVGDVVAFEIVATNGGNVSLTGVAITDSLPGLSELDYGPWPTTEGTLAPGESITATATYTITQADVDRGSIANTATATGTPPVGPAVQNTSTPAVVPTAAADPAIIVTHTGGLADGATGIAGDTVEWAYSLTNDGNVTLTDVSLTDPQPGQTPLVYTWPGEPGVLAPGQTVTATSRYVLTQADVDAGSVTTIVTGRGTPPTGADVAGTAPATVSVTPGPAITVEKSGGIRTPGTGLRGDTVDFDFTITNAGNVTLTEITLLDSLPGLGALTFTWPDTPRTLAPGASATATAAYTVRQADVDAGVVVNTATVSAVSPAGAAVADDSELVEVPLAEPDPGLTTTKTGTRTGAGGVVDAIDYVFTIENTGNVTLREVELDDDLSGLSTPVIRWPAATGVLAPGQTATATAAYGITQTDVDRGSVTNTAFSTGTPPTGPAVPSESVESVVTTVPAAPAAVFGKSVSLPAGASAAAGTEAAYTFTYRNSGNVTLTGVTIADPLPGLSALEYTWPGAEGTLAPGQTVTATATRTITQTDVDAGSVANTATATAASAQGGPLTRTASATLPLAPAPALTVTKDGGIRSPGTGRVGDVVDYSFVLRNTGNVTLTGVELTDTLPGLSVPEIDWPTGADGVLAPGQTATATAEYEITQADVDAGVVLNTATASGTPPTGPRVSADSAESVVTLAAAAPSIATTKTGTVAGAGVPGDVVTYEITAINTGTVTLTGVAIADPLAGLSELDYGTWPSTSGTLAPGQSISATATYVLTQADVDAGAVRNTATSTATTPAGGTVTGASPESVVRTQAAVPSVAITHTGALAAGSTGIAGDIVEWSYSFRNTGNVTLTDVSLTDPQPEQYDFIYSWPGSPGVLAPGETVTATSRYVLTQADVDAGSVTTIVTGRASPPTGADLVQTAPATVSVEPGPALSVTKSGVVVGDGNAGSRIDYTFEIRNTGNVTLTLVDLIDSLGGVSDPVITWPGAPGILLPGEIAPATATYTITQADVDAGTVLNTATATGTPPTGPNVSVVSTVSTVAAAPADPRITTTKSAVVSGDGGAGDTVTYTIVSRNTGNVTLTGVTIADDLDGLSPIAYGQWPSPTAGRLAPGQAVSATATYELTQADVDRGQVVNTATSSGTSPGLVTASDPSDEIVTRTAAAAPAFAVTHTGALAAGATGVAGDRVDWAYSLTNTGNVTLTGVSLTDPQPDQFGFVYDWPGAVGVLAPGQTVTAVSAYLLTQADVDAGSVTTVVTGSASSPAGPLPDQTAPATVPIGSTPLITVTKAGAVRAPGTGIAGDTVDYSFVIRNGGNVTLTGVELTDTLDGLSTPVIDWPAATGVLAPGASATATAVYTITQADVNAGRVLNTATARGTSPTGPAVTASSAQSVVRTAAAAPAIQTVKSAGLAGAGELGDTVTYEITATNTGNVTLTGVAISDPLPRLSAIDIAQWTGAIGTLEPGESVTGTATYVLDQADIDAGAVVNTATSTGTPPTGPAVRDASPEVSTRTADADPTIAVTHTGALAATATGVAGDIVEWSYSLENTGNVTLTGVSLTDPQPGQYDFVYSWPGETGILAPGEIVTATSKYRLTQADVDAGSVTTVVTGAGSPPAGADVRASAPATVSVAPDADVLVAITGTARLDARVGDVIDYVITATNTGNVTLSALIFAQQLPNLQGLTVDTRTIAPGETATARGSYTVTQADVDAGRVLNRATVSAGTPDDALISRTSAIVETPTPVAAPGILTTKSGAFEAGSTGEVGDVIRYSFAARNTGNVTLTGVTITDPLPGLSTPAVTWPGATGVLAPGQTATATATYAVTQEDLDRGAISNTATGAGTAPDGAVFTDDSPPVLTPTAAAAASVVVVDSGTLAPGATGIAGDTVIFTYTLTNTGNVTLTDAVIVDELLGVSPPTYDWPGEPGVLAPGQSVTATATYVLLQEDVDAGAVISSVTSESTAPDGEVVVDTDSETVPIEPAPLIVVTQDAVIESPGIGAVGDIIRFDVTVTNGGNVTITEGRPVIDLPGVFDVDIDWPGEIGTLQPGESLSGSARYRITQADVDRGFVVNTVDVEGRTPDGTLVRAASDSVTVSTVDSAASIGTVVTGTTTGAVGDTVEYTITTTNTGNVTLTGVTVADPALVLTPVIGTWPGTPGTLAPGQSVTSTVNYVLTQADVDRGYVDNAAISTGTPPTGAAVTGTSPNSRVDTADSEPKIAVTKTGSLPPGPSAAGTPFTWSYSLTNTGNVTLTGVELTDPLSGPDPIVYDWPGDDGVLAPGQTVTATASYPLTQSDIDAGAVTSTVTGTGTPPTGADVTGAAPATVAVTTRPAIAVSQLAALSEPAAGGVGDTIDFDFDIENTGNVTLTAIALIESNPRLADAELIWPGEPGTLAPGETATGRVVYTITQADVDAGSVRNTATTTGRAPVGTASASSTEALVPLDAESPSISITKTGSTAPGADGVGVGDIVSYRIEVANTGNVTLTGVTLSDPLTGLSTPSITWPGAPGTLAPGQVAVATATYAITQPDVDAGEVENTATATGTSPAGVVATGASAPSVVPTEAADAALVVTDAGEFAPGATGIAGDVVTFTYTVRNAGNVTLTDVTLADALVGVSAPTITWPGATALLQPGQSATATATYVLTQADVDAGSVSSVVTARGTTPVGAVLAETASATVPIAPAPSLTVTQRAMIESPGTGELGDIVRFDVTVTNPGNVTITDGRPVIDLAGVFDVDIEWPGTLAPGESLTGSARYRITQADIDRGVVVNTIDVQGTRPDGEIVRAASNEIAIPTVRAAASLTTTKTAVVDGAGRVGDRVEYMLTAENTGNVTLTGVAFTDELAGLGPITYGEWPSGTAGQLAPGDIVTATAEYVIGQVDFDAGEVVNTATSTGTAPDGSSVSDPTGPVTTPTADPAPAISVGVDAALAGGAGVAGGQVDLVHTIENTGDVTLTGVAISDPAGIAGTPTYTWPDPARPGVLRPGQVATATASATFTQGDVDSGAYMTIVDATGTPPTGAPATDSDADAVPLSAAPLLTIGQTAAPAIDGQTGLGDTVTYAYTVTNTGNVTLTDVAISGALDGLSGVRYVWPGTPGVLAPGQVLTATASYQLEQDDIDRGVLSTTATVVGTPPTGAPVAVESPVASVTTDAPLPLIATTKSVTVTSGTGGAGSVITYSFTISNTGNVTLRLVDLTDALAGVSRPVLNFPSTSGILAPGGTATGTATYTITQADLDRGSVANLATSTGTAPDGTVVQGTSPQSTVTTAAAAPGIETTHTAALAAGDTGVVGDLVEYSFVIVNTGNVSLSGVALVNTVAGIDGLAIAWPGTPGALAPGQRVTATATHVITQADVDAGVVRNTTTAIGTTPRGAGVTDDSPATAVPTVAAALALTIGHGGTVAGAGALGDDVTWTFTVRNTGNVTITGVTISDVLPGISPIAYGTWPGTVGTLAPGQEITATATYDIRQSDIDRGSARSTATVAGTPPAGPAVRATSLEAVVPTVAAASAIEVAKAQQLAPGAVGRAGDTVRYSYTVTNTGNTTLTGVVLADDQSGISPPAYTWPGAAGVLAPGATATATATYVLTQADVDAGRVASTVVATGTTPGASPVTDSAADETPITPAPVVTLALTGSFETIAQQGARVIYDYVITNTGTTTLTGVAITDLLPGLTALQYTWPADAGTLAPGQSATARGYYTITQDDVDAGPIESTATVAGTPPTGAAVTDTADESVLVPSRDDITLDMGVAVRDGRAGFPGDVLDYIYVVTNTGTTTLTGVRIRDPRTGLSPLAYGDWPGEVGVLLPGQSITTTAFWVITAETAGDVIASTATVTSTEIETGATVSDIAGVVIELPDMPIVPGFPGLPGTDGPSTDSPRSPVPPLLAFTGSDAAPHLGGGLLLLLSGLVLMLAARTSRRRSDERTEQA